jgi:hypothetical protein
MTLLIETIKTVAKVNETTANEIEKILMEYFNDVRFSEVSERRLNAAIREAVILMNQLNNMKCNHPQGTQHTMECVN